MAGKEQVRPLAPIRNEDDTSVHSYQRLHRRKFIKCCTCVLAFLLFLAGVIIILMFTIFRVKEPIIKLNGVKVTKHGLVNNITPKPGDNISLIVDISVKNPNIASFRYSNTTTTLYYHDIMVGEARGPPGHAKARRTMRMNVTVVVIVDRIMSSPNLSADMGSGLITMSSFSRVPGQVKILKLFKKHVIVKMSCTTTVNISTQDIQEQSCKRKVKL